MYEGDPLGANIDQTGAGQFLQRRALRLYLGLRARPSDSSSNLQIATDTHRIEICVAERVSLVAPTTITCPGTDFWLLYDDSTTPVTTRLGAGTETKSGLAARIGVFNAQYNSNSALYVNVHPAAGDPTWPTETDWASASAPLRALVLRVNNEATSAPASGQLPALAAEGGWCPVPRQLASNNRVRVIGVPDAPGPFSGASACSVQCQPAPFQSVCFPVCSGPKSYCQDGDRIGFGGSSCFSAVEATFFADRNEEMSRVHSDTFSAQVPLSPPSWSNGNASLSSCPSSEGFCSFFADVGNYFPHHGRAGGYHVHAGIRASIPRSLAAGNQLDRAGHEFMHYYQDAWRRKKRLDLGFNPDPTMTGAFHQLPVSEGITDALAGHGCIDNYDSYPDKVCLSAGMLGKTNYGTQSWLQNPGTNALAGGDGYSTATFWLYLFEQFAVPRLPGEPAHPGGKDSVRTVAAAGNVFPPLGNIARRSDEGMDLAGVLLDRMSSNPHDPVFSKTTNEVAIEYLGRNLENIVLDYHTMALLKDYKEISRRWRLAWAGDWNAGAAKHPVPGTSLPSYSSLDSIKGSPSFASKELKTTRDSLYRVLRLEDSHLPGSCAACTPTLAPFDGSGIAPLTDPYLQPFGAGYLSVAPSPALIASGKPVRFRIISKSGLPPRVRLFHVDSSGTPSLACSSNSEPGPGVKDICLPSSADGKEWDIHVPLSASSREVLAVVSNPSPISGLFSYQIGATSPQIKLIDPSATHRSFVGSRSDRRPFLAQFVVRDENNEGINVAPEQISIEASGCANPMSCVLPKAAVQIGQLGQGTYWATVLLPESFYPDPIPPGTIPRFDLQVKVSLPSTTLTSNLELKALEVSEDDPKTVLQVVLDRSGSMGDNGGIKLKAARLATAIALGTLKDTDEFGLVTFNNDAQSPLTFQGPGSPCPDAGGDPIVTLTPDNRARIAAILDDLTALGWTSIGDGGLEATSNFIKMGYDQIPTGASPTPNLSMMILSDGLSNAGHPDDRFYKYNPGNFSDGTLLPTTVPPSEDPDPCDNGFWAAGVSGTLAYLLRKATPGLQVPTLSTIALGQGADGNTLKTMADVGGGSFIFADADLIAEQQQANFYLADSMLQHVHSLAGRQRSSSKVVSTLSLPPVLVEPSSRRLSVSITAGVGLGSLRLVSPSGQIVAPSLSIDGGAVFTVALPEVGLWTWATGASAPPAAGDVMLEIGFSTPIALFARADVGGITPLSGTGAGMPARYTHRPVTLHAMVAGGLVSSVSARVRRPGGAEVDVPLFDDGKHADGLAGDGLFGAIYKETGDAGAYQVRIVASGQASREGAPFEREQLTAVGLVDGPDADGDGMPDWWETSRGLDPARNDAEEDPDLDGLSNLREFLLGTSPLASDSDGGGESDGHEVGAGRNPADPSDDAVRGLAVSHLPGNGRVRLTPILPPGENATVEIARASSRQGRYKRLTLLQRRTVAGAMALSEQECTCPLDASAAVGPTCRALADNPYQFECAAPQGESYCYILRVTTEAGTSGWSEPACMTANPDPYAPRIESLSLVGSGNITRTRAVRLEVRADDAPIREGMVSATMPDPDAVTTGVRELQVSMGGGFVGVPWQPYQPELPLWLPEQPTTSLHVRVRDGAGNVSSERFVVIEQQVRTPVDGAIRVEERALDLLNAGQPLQARVQVQQSLEPLGESLVRLIKESAKTPGSPSQLDLQLRGKLLEVLARKKLVIAWLTAKKYDKARQELQEALEVERELAEQAAAAGRTL